MRERQREYKSEIRKERIQRREGGEKGERERIERKER
jgi:hypothetical protein